MAGLSQVSGIGACVKGFGALVKGSRALVNV